MELKGLGLTVRGGTDQARKKPLLNFARQRQSGWVDERSEILGLDKEWTKSAPGSEPAMM